MPLITRNASFALLLILALLLPGCKASRDGTPRSQSLVTGELQWRGHAQNGTSLQTALPAKAVIEGDNANLRWTFDVPGGGTPINAEYNDGPRLFVLG